MRIISGKYGGRVLETPKNKNVIRPTSDKVRGAIFNGLHSLGCVRNSRVLDLFCGTGALGLEALSRGAAHCLFVDKSVQSLSLAQHNAEALGVADEQCDFMRTDARSFPNAEYLYDLVIMDPPYKQNLIEDTLQYLVQHTVLSDRAVIVIEAEKSFCLEDLNGFSLLNEKSYGDTKVLYLRYNVTRP